MSAVPISKEQLRHAVATDAIRPVFQPIVRIETKRISSFEVLARWRDPILGDVPPSTFIPLLEKWGLIGPATDHIIRSACRSALSWPGEFKLTFNISPLHFQDGAMPLLLEGAVGEIGFPISRTQIEITESAVLTDLDEARKTIDTLRSKGVHVLLDDFGTGYSSLARLRVLPFDKIKIDASFVATMEASRDSRKIVGAVIGLGQSLGVPIIAEGIETYSQEEILRHLGCDFGQGWLYSPALCAKAVPAVLAQMGQQPLDPRPMDLSTNQRLAQLEVIYNLAPVGLCFLDTDLRILKVNKQWFTIRGEPVLDCVGRELADIAPDLARFVLDDVAATVPEQMRADPEKIDLTGGVQGELTIVPTTDETNGMIGWALMISPISTKPWS